MTGFELRTSGVGLLANWATTTARSGQSYKRSTIIIYTSGVLPTIKCHFYSSKITSVLGVEIRIHALSISRQIP